MPGILPMKVIKVGNTSQSRIAQACDRCRSKKIRCDGFRPTCSQCANVGFECKTSDKLSRRAFPRGYTESLEERVRSLEGETRELKELLDEKDEKIDMLSRMQSQCRQRRGSVALSSRRASSSTATATSEDLRSALLQDRDESFKILQSPLLHAELNNDAYFMGASSGRSFIDAFKQRVQESGRQCCALDPDVFFPSTDQRAILAASPHSPPATSWVAPPRIMSDKMVNIFFQEWAPLFPTLHKPSFLTLYETYVSGTDVVDSMQSLAQLNLVFGIAALSSTNLEIASDIQRCEAQWKAALETFMLEVSLTNLQCLTLAQIFCIQKGDVSSLLHYKSLAVGISHRLGLHQSQKRFALGALTGETRKKVFWSLYVLDCFSAAFMGLPRLIKEVDVHCEYPVDVDDEYVTEQGFQPTLPGEATKISAALALFRVCRILARTLDEIYPAATSHEVSLRTISELEADLEEWSEDLPPHLRLQFVQGKPSTNIISSRCPLLSLAYHYIHVLIHRPVVCANVDTQSSASLLAVATSSKSIVQIIQLLQERNLSFSFCLNRNDVLVLSGFGLLYQVLDLEAEGRLLLDYSRLLADICGLLQNGLAPGAAEFRALCQSIVCLGDSDMSESEPLPDPSSEEETKFQPMVQTVYQPGLAAARYTSSKMFRKERRDTKEFHPHQQSPSQTSGKKATKRGSFSKTSHSPLLSGSSSQPRGQPRQLRSNSSSLAKSARPVLTPDPSSTNLDFFTFPDDPEPGLITRPHSGPAPGEWEQLLASLDTSQPMLYETLCSPTSKPNTTTTTTTAASTSNAADSSSMLSPDDMSSPETLCGGAGAGAKYHSSLYASPDVDDSDPLLHDPDWPSSSCWSLGLESSTTATSTMAPPPDLAASVLSFSDDSLTSGGDEFSSVGDVGSSHGNSNAGFHGIGGLPLDVLSEAVDTDSLDFEELTV